VLKFGESRKDNPETIRAWFYPADGFGQEFVYPKKRAIELAETAKVPVLTAEVTPAEQPEELVKEPVAVITPDNTELAEVNAPFEEPMPLIALSEPPPEPAAEVPLAELPQTAGSLPLLLLSGLCALAAAAALRLILRRVV
jgi:hypothetical protein